MSGFSNDPVMAQAARHGYGDALGTPLTGTELEEALQRVHGGGRGARTAEEC